MQEIAQGRGKTVPQVNSILLVLSTSRLYFIFQACAGHGVARQPWMTAHLVRCVCCGSFNWAVTGTHVQVLKMCWLSSCLDGNWRTCLLFVVVWLAYKPSLCCFYTLPCKHHTGCRLLMSTYFGIHTHVCFKDSTSAEWERERCAQTNSVTPEKQSSSFPDCR